MARKIADVVRARVVQLRTENPSLTFQMIAYRLGLPARTAMKIMRQEKRRQPKTTSEGIERLIAECYYCGAETLLLHEGSRPICIECDNDRVAARKKREDRLRQEEKEAPKG